MFDAQKERTTALESEKETLIHQNEKISKEAHTHRAQAEDAHKMIGKEREAREMGEGELKRLLAESQAGEDEVKGLLKEEREKVLSMQGDIVGLKKGLEAVRGRALKNARM